MILSASEYLIIWVVIRVFVFDSEILLDRIICPFKLNSTPKNFPMYEMGIPIEPNIFSAGVIMT